MLFKEKIKKFIPNFLLNSYHFCLALLGAVFYGFPGFSKEIRVIGVTGTSGKSTTVDFITRILEEGGYKIASISSIRFKINERVWENKYKMTMPGRFVIQKFLSRAKKNGSQFVVLEVTSEGIRQFRHKFIRFDTVVFTNLSKEHIESHGGFEKYREAKLKLFRENRNIHIINSDDFNSQYFIEIPANKKILFSLKDAKNVFLEQERINFEIENKKFTLNMRGDFNIMNALAAIATARNYGIDLEICSNALKKAKSIEGRMEVVIEYPFTIIVDYAHTPDQLEKVYQSFKRRDLICVLGSCGGGRDKWKRSVLGEIASRYCKYVLVTNEDPYDEDPLEIIEQVVKGVEEAVRKGTSFSKVEKILDRKEAIKKAVDFAQKGDIIVITGKGCEPWMCIENGKKIPWDDREIAREAFRNRKV